MHKSKPAPAPTNLTAVILAGGRGSRLGGQDKGLLMLHGKPFCAHQLEALRPQVAEVLLNVNRNHDRYAQLGITLVDDRLSDFQGPLAGIHAALTQIKTDYLLSVPCDAPNIPPDYAQRMLEAAQRQQQKIAVAHDGEREQPVYLLLHRSLFDSLTEYLSAGDRKIDRWYQAAGYVQVLFEDRKEMFVNANTPEELEAVMHHGS